MTLFEMTRLHAPDWLSGCPWDQPLDEWRAWREFYELLCAAMILDL